MDVETEKYIESLLAAKERSLRQADVETSCQKDSRRDEHLSGSAEAIEHNSLIQTNSIINDDSAHFIGPQKPSESKLYSGPAFQNETQKDEAAEGRAEKDSCQKTDAVIVIDDDDDADPDVMIVDSKPRPTYHYNETPSLKRVARAEFASTENVKNNFLKGCKWSPDGSCLLTGK